MSVYASAQPGQELAQGHQLGVRVVIEPATTLDEFGAKVAQVRDRPAEGRQPQLEEGEKYLEHRAWFGNVTSRVWPVRHLRSVQCKEFRSRPALLRFFPIGIHSMDAISLLETGPFLAAIAGYEHRIRHVFFGHIHRPIFGTFRGIPYSTLRGTNHQVALDLHGRQSDILGVHEQPQYGVVQVDADQVLIHLEDFLNPGDTYSLGTYGHSVAVAG